MLVDMMNVAAVRQVSTDWKGKWRIYGEPHRKHFSRIGTELGCKFGHVGEALKMLERFDTIDSGWVAGWGVCVVPTTSSDLCGFEVRSSGYVSILGSSRINPPHQIRVTMFLRRYHTNGDSLRLGFGDDDLRRLFDQIRSAGIEFSQVGPAYSNRTNSFKRTCDVVRPVCDPRLV